MKKVNPSTAEQGIDHRIDNLDRQIVSLLMQDTNRPYSEIAQQLIVSNATIHVRIKKLKEIGLITGTRLVVDVGKLGFNMVAYIGIIVERAVESYAAAESMKNIQEIVELYFITGTYNLLVRVACHDSEHLLCVLKDKIQPIKGVARTETLVILGEGLRRPIQLDL